jgi:hypothetical protein
VFFEDSSRALGALEGDQSTQTGCLEIEFARMILLPVFSGVATIFTKDIRIHSILKIPIFFEELPVIHGLLDVLGTVWARGCVQGLVDCWFDLRFDLMPQRGTDPNPHEFSILVIDILKEWFIVVHVVSFIKVFCYAF